MKKIIRHIIFLAFIFGSIFSYSQNDRVLGYKIINDEVIFTFDKRDYEKITNDGSEEMLDFNDLTIENVVVSGEFNNWSLKKWTMHKIDENTLGITETTEVSKDRLLRMKEILEAKLTDINSKLDVLK